MRIIVGVGAGIAAYKIAHLVRLFTEAGHDVHVIPTPASLQFVGAATWEALSHHPVSTSVFENVDQVQHVRLGQDADLVVLAPATADLMAKAACGMADTLLSATLLMSAAPVVMVPAMHTEMWNHLATRHNVSVLRERGVHVMEPESGRLTGTDTGPGRMPEPEQIYHYALEALNPVSASAQGPWHGKKVLVSAGGTREPLDPVRYLGNRSSGKQGIALAKAARARGAHVTLIGANIPDPGSEVDTTFIGVETTEQLRAQMVKHAPEADLIVMAAAVADFRPDRTEETKIKKVDGGAPTINLIQNPDILAELGHSRDERKNQVLVGFAAETGDQKSSALDYAQDKLARKGADLLVFNDVSNGGVFGSEENSVTLLERASGGSGEHRESNASTPARFSGSKTQVAEAIMGYLEHKLG